jgi:hypothetical protein
LKEKTKMAKCEEIPAECGKKTYEEPTLVEREDLLQVTEGVPVGVSETIVD